MKIKIIVMAALIMTISGEQAGAAEITMSINFVGDWCYESVDGSTTNYKLPSWTEGGVCEKILSIAPWGFYGEGRHCKPINVRETKDCAPSGCHHDSLVLAQCEPDGPVGKGERKQFVFSRYKGHLYVTER